MAGSLRSEDENGDQPIADINVTPLVDVMLVLLIVFMIAAPLMTSGIPVDLPKANAKPLTDQKTPLAVSVNAAGAYFINNEETPAELLITSLKNQAENELDRRVHVRADKDLAYRAVIEVMSKISSAGFTKVALVAEAPKTGAAPQAPVGGAPVAAAGGQDATSALAPAGAPSAAAPAASAAVAAPAAALAPSAQ